MNIDTLDWNEEICAEIGVPSAMLPEIRTSSEVYAQGHERSLVQGVPIAGILGDQHAATCGQACFTPGQGKNTYGTGNFMLMNTGEELIRNDNGLLTTVAYQLKDRRPVYALEGSIAVTGSLIQWLRDNLGLIRDAADASNELKELKVDGGMVVNETLMQFQADLLGVDVVRPEIIETTALGAAYAAGLAVGFWESTDEVAGNWAEDRRWSPQRDAAEREELLGLWKRAVSRSFDWVE